MARTTKGETERLNIAKREYQRGFDDGLKQTGLGLTEAPAPAPVGTLASSAFATIAGRGDGWLRITFEDNGKTVFAKYKFTSGPFAGYYTMYVGTYYPAITELLCGLLDKLHDADCGQLVPTLDRYHQF